MSLVVPAVLPSSRKDFEEKLAVFSSIPSINRVQIDIVDGRFAEPVSWPYTAPAEVNDMVAHSEMLPNLDRLAYEIDLMCLDADHAAGIWLALGATRLTFHAESMTDVPRFLASVRGHYGVGSSFASGLISFGFALDIASDLALIESCIGEVTYVQFMGIAEIGRQGQPFDTRVFEKVRIFHSRHPEIPVQVDGGISLESAKKLIALGVSNLVIGSGILRTSDPTTALAAFEELQSPYGV